MGNTKPKKKSTRRSVSMRGLTYQRIKIYCDREGMAVSDFIETIAGRELDKKGKGQALADAALIAKFASQRSVT